jgi:hypothetical protein
MPKTADELARELRAEVARRERELDALRIALAALSSRNGKRPAGRRASGKGRGRPSISSPGARASR